MVWFGVLCEEIILGSFLEMVFIDEARLKSQPNSNVSHYSGACPASWVADQNHLRRHS